LVRMHDHKAMVLRDHIGIQMNLHTAIPIPTEGRFQVFQRLSGSKLVLRTLKKRYAALNYHENGSTAACHYSYGLGLFLRTREYTHRIMFGVYNFGIP
jgi:hypothetical protein